MGSVLNFSARAEPRPWTGRDNPGLPAVRGGDEYLSWGRVTRPVQRIVEIGWPSDVTEVFAAIPREVQVLARGLGRSYGDSCLLHDGVLMAGRGLRRFRSFDRSRGVIVVEAGASLQEILDVIVPAGWFLPVLPGTRYVTVGGAIANDIHGKNHHASGTFGDHVLRLSLVRSEGNSVECSRDSNQDLFSATIGGLGLTGFIEWAEIQLVAIETAFMSVEEIQFEGLQEFFSISGESDHGFEYTVAWLDCVHRNRGLPRGIFIRGNHASRVECPSSKFPSSRLRSHGGMRGPLVSIPMQLPSWVLSPPSVRAFNTLYYHKQIAKKVRSLVPYEKFFFPLDGVGHWNRVYGSQGFFQFQCVVPERDSVSALLDLVLASQQASFLAVLKCFGKRIPCGLLSFPREGITLCMDFANRGMETRRLLERLELIVRESRGALYPAKDACMQSQSFIEFYPRLNEFMAFRDPRIMSDFFRRIMNAAV